MEKRDMIEVLVSYYCGGNKAKFAAKLGIKPQALSMWISRNSFDAELIYKNCEDVSAEWLLSGMGEMLRTETNKAVADHGGLIQPAQGGLSRWHHPLQACEDHAQPCRWSVL